MKIGVIGGGVAGLTAGYELSKLGHTVAVFEKDAVLGGQASTFDLEGVPLERFYHHIFTSDVDIIQLIEEVGLGPRLQWPGSKVGFYHGGRIYDFVTALELLRFGPVSLIDRVRLGLISLYLKWYGNWQALEGVTARQWLIKYGGRRTYDVVWGPLLKNKFGASADDIGMVWLWGKIHLRMSSRHGGREHLGYLDGSYGVLFERLKELIVEAGGEVHTSAPVERVVVEDGKAVGLQVGQEVHPCDLILAKSPK